MPTLFLTFNWRYNMEDLQAIAEEKPKTLIELLDGIEESSRYGQQADSIYRSMKDIKVAKDALNYRGSLEELDVAAAYIRRCLNNPINANTDYQIQAAIANAPSVSSNIDYI